jgi:hypothetical protein
MMLCGDDQDGIARREDFPHDRSQGVDEGCVFRIKSHHVLVFFAREQTSERHRGDVIGYG